MRRHPVLRLSLALSILSVVASCKTVSNSAQQQASNVSSAGNKSCPNYPRVYRADENAYARAEAQLSLIVHNNPSTPSLYWSKTRGTLKALNDVAIPICGEGSDLNEAIAEALTASKDLFQVTPADWNFPSPIACSDIKDGSAQSLRLKRKAFGSYPQLSNRDRLTIVVRNTKGKYHINKVFGNYLPELNENLEGLFASCSDSPYQDNLSSEIKKTTFALATFNNCSYLQPASYTAHASDRVEYDSTAAWDYVEDKGEILFYKSGSGRLLVDAKNVSEDLRASDAYCNNAAGFELTFDSVTGRVSTVKNGVGCTLCPTIKK
jgi:hypothetical protein